MFQPALDHTVRPLSRPQNVLGAWHIVWLGNALKIVEVAIMVRDTCTHTEISSPYLLVHILIASEFMTTTQSL